MGSSSKGYQFVTNGSSVTAVYEQEHGRMQQERMKSNETWSFDGLNVTRTETEFGKVEISTYTDVNQDGLFQKSFELEVVTGASLRALETYKFALADGSAASGDLVMAGDAVTGALKLGRGGWKSDRLDANERVDVVEVGADTLILKTEIGRSGKIEFSVFRDDDGDALWTEIASGETRTDFVSPDGQIDLVGIANAGLLQAADLVVG